MSGMALRRSGLIPRRSANWTRIVAVTFAVLALLALSFVLGRVTIGHTEHTTTIVRPVVVQPVTPSVGSRAPIACYPHLPC